MSATLPIGIAGCGRITERSYLPALARMQEVSLAAVADPNAERRELIASRAPGCVAHESVEAMIDEGRLGALVVATPTATHAAIGASALDAGIPVLIEKPLAGSSSELAPLVRRAASPGDRMLMVAFNRRFWQPARRLKSILRGESVGTPREARLVMTGEIRGWGSIVERSDALSDLGTHQVDLLRYLFDRDLVAVRASWTDPETIRFRVTLEDGMKAECVASHAGQPSESVTVRCAGATYFLRRGSERIGPPEGTMRGLLDTAGAAQRLLLRRSSAMRLSFERQLEYFVRCVQGGAPPEPSLADGVAALRAVEAARESAAHDEREMEIRR